MIFRWSTIL